MRIRTRSNRSIPLATLLACLAFAQPGAAQDGPEESAEASDALAEPAEEAAEDAEPDAPELSAPPDEGLESLDAPPLADVAAPLPASEYLVGVRYRGILIPKAVLGLFVDGGKSVYVHGFGPELAIADDDIEYNLSAWAALYDMSPVAIKGSANEELAWEIVSADMTAVYFTGDVMWRTSLASRLDLTYGGSGGVGLLVGDLNRTQAYLVDGGTEGNADDYRPCVADGDPDFVYCDDANAHYPGYGEPGWFNGGAKPVLFPWLSAQLGLRYQAHPRFVARLDLGVGSSGVYFGVGADYGL